MKTLFAGWSKVMSEVTRARCLIGMCVFRVLAGLGILWEYLGVYHQRHFLFGPNGIDGWEDFRRSSRLLYSFSSAEWYFELVFHAGALITLLWTMGYRPRWTTPIMMVFWRSLGEHSNLIWDGGDNLLQIVLVYACFADVGAHLSLDSSRDGRAPPSPAARAALAILHNGAVLACALQLSIVYTCAGLAKVRGPLWQDGTALYYAMRTGEFAWPGLSNLIYTHSYLVTFLCYSTVAFQVGFFPSVFLNRYTRRLTVFVSVAFHLGIMTFMGLPSFALFLMATDLSLLSDDEYRAIARLGRTAWTRSWRRAAPPSHAAATSPLPPMSS